jgi:hypothetical protein
MKDDTGIKRDHPLFISLEKGALRTFTYGNLLDLVSLPDSYQQICLGPRLPLEAITGLLAGLILNQKLTFCPQTKILRADAADANPGDNAVHQWYKVPGKPFQTVSEMIQSARASSDFRIGIYSRGQGGAPRKVVHSLRSLKMPPAEASSSSEEHEVLGIMLPPTWIGAIEAILGAFFNGDTIVNLWGENRLSTLKLIAETGVNRLILFPSDVDALWPIQPPVDAIARVDLTGGPVDNEVMIKLHQIFPGATINNNLCLTETGTLLTTQDKSFQFDSAEDFLRIEAGVLYVHRDHCGTLEKQPSSNEVWLSTGMNLSGDVSDSIKLRLQERLSP